MMKTIEILFIDDDPGYTDQLNYYYKNAIQPGKNVTFHFFNSSLDLLAQKERMKNADMVVADLRLGDDSGLDLLELVRKENSKTKLILITGQLITQKEQVRCKKINAEFLFKGYGTGILMDNITYFSQAKH